MTFSSYPVITRFAPSPTGKMTLGNYRTALWAYLFALKNKGQFILRIEDTDRERSKQEYVDGLFSDLKAMGLVFDPDMIVYQSQRNELYRSYSQQLQEKGLAYECFCTQEELALERKVQLASKKPPRYSGKCRHLSIEQKNNLRSQGRTAVLRFHVTEEKISFVDVVLGEKTFFGNDIGDFIIEKSDGEATFFFCNAIDDALSGVTHALRGEDHLTNTPRQLALLKALDLPQPIYGHLPLILGHDHKPLSKRNGSVSIEQLLQEGYYPNAINNYCARLGHHIQSQELLSLEELGAVFDLHALSASAAHFDRSQLLYWQKRAFDSLSASEHTSLISKWAPDTHNPLDFMQLVQPHLVLGSDLQEWNERLHSKNTNLIDPSAPLFKENGWNKFMIQDMIQSLDHGWDEFKKIGIKHGVKGKAFFHPLRYLLTGLPDGPKLEDLFAYISKELLKMRLSQSGDAL